MIIKLLLYISASNASFMSLNGKTTKKSKNTKFLFVFLVLCHYQYLHRVICYLISVPVYSTSTEQFSHKAANNHQTWSNCHRLIPTWGSNSGQSVLLWWQVNHYLMHALSMFCSCPLLQVFNKVIRFLSLNCYTYRLITYNFEKFEICKLKLPYCNKNWVKIYRP